MKSLKLFVTFSLIIFSSTAFSQTQTYCTLEYWGKQIPIDQNFFRILNSKYESFIKESAPTYKYYDFRDYNESYRQIVDNLRSPTFEIIVTEANDLQWRNSIGQLPGTKDESNRSKKSHVRASLILNYVVLPSLQQFANNYTASRQFQY